MIFGALMIEPRLPFNAHLLASKFEAFAFSVHCNECNHKTEGSVADESEESAFPFVRICNHCGSTNTNVGIGHLRWHNHLRVV